MSIGALTFLSPWLLAGLLALPIIYWLLRTVPPRPRQITFPPTRILVGLENREKTPDKTPWWLMLIRMLAAAMVIFALAEPILNPNPKAALEGSGPVAIVVDNGWSASAEWPERVRMMDRLIDQAASDQRPVVVVGTAEPANRLVQVESPNDARKRAAALVPQPFAPLRLKSAERLDMALAGQSGASVVWLSDGVDHGRAVEFIDRIATLADAGLSVVTVGDEAAPLGAVAVVSDGGKLRVKLVRPFGGQYQGEIAALSGRGERLSEARFNFSADQTTQTIEINLPLELRNQVSRVAISNERSAGAVHLLDARSRWSRIGLISGAERDRDQPLLGPLYYVRRALAPYGELVEYDTANLAEGVTRTLKRRPSMLVLTDVGVLPGGIVDQVADWVDQGGTLVRFAGPRLEKGGDDLLPAPLRTGGRTLGGALSWSTPQPMAEFGEHSLFAGLEVSRDVLVRRQVLADPTRLPLETAVWARLQDGTPLVTATKRGDGTVVLFHVTANPAWSNLPLSGLFVEMLRRVSAVGNQAGEPGGIAAGPMLSGQSTSAAPNVLTPVQVLDGFGQLSPPPPTTSAIALTDFATVRPQLSHPPGYYGPAGRPRALNIVTEDMVLSPLPSLPSATSVLAYEKQTSTDLKPWLLALALTLLFIDVVAILVLQSGGLRLGRVGRAMGAGAVGGLFVHTMLLMVTVPDGWAQTAQRPPADTGGAGTQRPPVLDAKALAATSRVTLGYIETGDAGIDGTSQAGLAGLSRILSMRTSVEPGEPAPIDVENDEIAFFPLIYWPVIESQEALSAVALGKVDAYMKQGGLIIFDTRDYGQGMPIGFSQRALRQDTPLQRLLGKLDIPRLEPVPQGHVLTKSFYLLDRFPGRWAGGQLWVEAGGGNTISADRKARQADGVSSILITANDFATAWALDERNLPLFPVVPGGERQREMAFRTGVNIMMYALTGNYKADQVHVPALLERLGQ
ncbi:MAG: DUF4159 domain-containing protein [Hyphomicrobiaceae bacterium]